MKAGIQTDYCTLTFIAALLTRKWGKQFKCPSTDKRICKLSSRHVTKLSFTLKKEGNSNTGPNMVNFEDTVLSKISQSQRYKCYMTPLRWGT